MNVRELRIGKIYRIVHDPSYRQCKGCILKYVGKVGYFILVKCPVCRIDKSSGDGCSCDRMDIIYDKYVSLTGYLKKLRKKYKEV